MAPTEVLAKQHYESVTELFEKYQIPLKAELLIGSMTAKEKRLAYERIKNGEVQIILGTHALIQQKVESLLAQRLLDDPSCKAYALTAEKGSIVLKAEA